jgi:predicted dehydrogenase
MSNKSSRRQFLKTSSVVAAGATLAGGLTISQSAHAQGSDQIKLALIGCGGRGGGAIRDRAQVGDNFKVVAVADAFEGQAQKAARDIRADAEKDGNHFRNKVDLPDDRVFWGLDGYKKAIACLSPGDQVVIATPPGFRPYQYRAAIERGCHVFMEKPLFVDAPGFRHTMETNRMADEKKLKVCVGFQRRADPRWKNWIEQIHAGKIGNVQFTRVYWNGDIWCRPRERGQNELQYQVHNWYHFVWLCGENICEQHCHNLDVGNWIHGKGDRMAHPVKANAQGGRTRKAGPEDLMRQAPPFSDRAAWDEWYFANRGRFYRYGQAWDHFFVEFEYADGSRMFSQCRHIPNTWSLETEFVHGTAGTGNNSSRLFGLDGEEIWRNTQRAPKGSMQWEHDVLVKAIREDTPMNDGYHSAMACMISVLGREAAYCGQIVEWDKLVAEGRSYFPNGEITSFEDIAPVQPDADGFYENSVPVPGVYKPFV